MSKYYTVWFHLAKFDTSGFIGVEADGEYEAIKKATRALDKVIICDFDIGDVESDE